MGGIDIILIRETLTTDFIHPVRIPVLKRKPAPENYVLPIFSVIYRC